MNHQRLWIAAIIIAFVLVVGFILSVPHTNDAAQTALLQNETANVPVTLHDTFKKGVHTITGSIDVANVCTTVTAEAALTNDSSGIVVELSLPEDSGVCLQLPTHLNFSTTISAPQNLPITATINGSVATTSIL